MNQLKETRFAVFIAMAPALGQVFQDSSQVQTITDPILIIGGANDDRTPVKTNALHYLELIKHAKYEELPGAVGHYIFLNLAQSRLQKEAPVIFQDDPSVDRAAAHAKISHLIIDFLAKEL